MFPEKASEGTRTLDIQLGKLALYQLSYARANLQTSKQAIDQDSNLVLSSILGKSPTAPGAPRLANPPFLGFGDHA